MRMVWVDFETTGLDASTCSILEVAAAIADFKDPFNVKVIHQSVIWFHPDLVKTLRPVVIEMHTKNGLFKECANETNAVDVWEAEEALLAACPPVEDPADGYVVAGSSVHFDIEFIKVWMPKLWNRLQFREDDVRRYDVSVLKLECQSQGMPKLPRSTEAHRALGDIKASIADAIACREWLHLHPTKPIRIIPEFTGKV